MNMTPHQIKQACLEQLLYGEEFLKMYKADLKNLATDDAFIRIISDIKSAAPLDTIFPSHRDSQKNNNVL